MQEREDRSLSETEEMRNRKKERRRRHTIVTSESFCAVFALFSALAFMIMVTDSAVFGEPGAYVRALLVATFGYAAYPLALLCAYNCAMGFIGVKLFKRRAAVGMLLVTAALSALVGHAVQTLFLWEMPLDGYVSACFNSQDLSYGTTVAGLLGALPVYFLASLTTEIGALVILAAPALLCLYITLHLTFKVSGAKKEKTVRREKRDGERMDVAESASEYMPFTHSEADVPYAGQSRCAEEYPSNQGQSWARESSRMPQREEQVQPLSGYETHSFNPQNMGGNQPYVPYTVHRHPGFNINNGNGVNGGNPSTHNDGYEQATAGYSPFGAATPKQAPSKPLSQEETRQILFGTNPRQNYQDNLIFDNNARVNNREPVNPAPYSEQYRRSVQNETTPRPQKIVGDSGENFGRRQSNPYALDSSAQVDASSYGRAQSDSSSYGRVQEPNSGYASNRAPIKNESASSFDQEPSSYDRRSLGDRRAGNFSYSNPYALDERENRFVSSQQDSSYEVASTNEEPPVQASVEQSQPSSGRRRHQYMDLFSKENPNVFGRSGNRLEEEHLSDDFVQDRSNLFEEEEPPVFQTEEQTYVQADDTYSLRSYDEEPKVVPHHREIQPLEETVEEAPVRTERQTFGRDYLPHANALPGRGNSIEDNAPIHSSVKEEESTPVEKPRIRKPYVRVPLHYFNCNDTLPDADAVEVEEIKRSILETLEAYGVLGGEIASVTYGPTLTRYNIVLPRGVSAKKVLSLDQEIAMGLCREGVTVALNVGNGVVSVEVPNRIRQTVELGCMFIDDAFTKAKPTSLVFAMGKDITNQKVYGDVCKMTHLLVAGSSGSGKSVFLGCLIISLITKYSPDELRLILIDPKKTEFVLYNNLPHLMVNEIITDCKKAVQSLSWAIGEMERRYTLFQKKTLSGTYVVNIDEYNANLEDGEEKLPKLVIIVDELADLMLNAKKDMEEKIQSLTQKARAAGIHLILATQRPSTDVITGVIKSNLPTRIAFTVATDVDSRVILDQTGAQKLLGKGDMIYTASGINTPVRLQSPFISSSDSQRVVKFIKENNEAFFDERASTYINNVRSAESNGAEDDSDPAASEPVYLEALKLAIQTQTASISMLQRKCSIGFNKAGKIIEWMEKRGFISSYEGAKARTVLITREEFIQMFGEW